MGLCPKTGPSGRKKSQSLPDGQGFERPRIREIIICGHFGNKAEAQKCFQTSLDLKNDNL